MSGIDPELLSLLVCPVTRSPLRPSTAGDLLISDAAGIGYTVRDGVPVLVAELAEPVAPPDQTSAP